MNWLDENAIWLTILGVLSVAILGGGWIQTGRKPLVYALAAAVLATAGLLLTEWLYVTDKEQVRQTLHEIAAEVEDNNLEAVLRYVHAEADDVRGRAEREFPNYVFEDVSIKRNLEIDVSPEHKPPKAVAKFNVMVIVSERSGLLSDQRVPRYVIATFYKEEGRWQVWDYEHHSPQRGIMTDR